MADRSSGFDAEFRGDYQPGTGIPVERTAHADLRPELRHTNERSLGELLGELAEDMSLLVRQEVQLAKTEISAKVSHVTTDLVTVGAGAAVALVGGLTLVAALVLGLVAIGVAPWLSALIVGAVLGLVGYGMLRGGLNDLKHRELTPDRTVQTIKEDIEAVKEARP